MSFAMFSLSLSHFRSYCGCFPEISCGFLVADIRAGPPHGLNLISDGEQVETLKSLCSSLFCVGPLCLKPPLQAGGKTL